MLQDTVRTSTYCHAIANNPTMFKDKVVLDVGAGSGILSFFAAQAGAKKVYAVEASNAAIYAKKLVQSNNLQHVIEVIQGKIEEVNLPEKVDILISEPIGVFLLHERMVESYLFARDRWLVKCETDDLKKSTAYHSSVQMFPHTGIIKFAPFSDSGLFNETIARASFWNQCDFYGVDLSVLAQSATDHAFSQPVIGSFDPVSVSLSPAFSYRVPFYEVSCDVLKDFIIPFSFTFSRTGIVHGFAGWFDLEFPGHESNEKFPITLSTAPEMERTHWYQVRFVFKTPLALNVGQMLSGELQMKVNNQRSYYITINGNINGTDIKFHNEYHLHEQQYSFLAPADPKPENYCIYDTSAK